MLFVVWFLSESMSPKVCVQLTQILGQVTFKQKNLSLASVKEWYSTQFGNAFISFNNTADHHGIQELSCRHPPSLWESSSGSISFHLRVYDRSLQIKGDWSHLASLIIYVWKDIALLNATLQSNKSRPQPLYRKAMNWQNGQLSNAAHHIKFLLLTRRCQGNSKTIGQQQRGSRKTRFDWGVSCCSSHPIFNLGYVLLCMSLAHSYFRLRDWLGYLGYRTI
jgi:hypothetical protein